MPKNRQKTRANKKKEKQIEMANKYGIADPTPYEAVKEIIRKQKQGDGKQWKLSRG